VCTVVVESFDMIVDVVKSLKMFVAWPDSIVHVCIHMYIIFIYIYVCMFVYIICIYVLIMYIYICV